MDAFASWLRVVPPEWIVAWCGIAAAVILGVRKAWPGFRRAVGALSRGIKLVDTLGTLPEDIAFIRHELDDNSGGSVKDAVKRTEAAVAELRGEVGHVRRQTASLKTSLARTNRQLAEHIDLSTENDADHEPRNVRGSTH